MAHTYETSKVFDAPIDELFAAVKTHVRAAKWEITFTDELTLEGGKRVKQLNGVSHGAGVTLLGMISSGAQFVPFIVKMTEQDAHKTEVRVIAGGADSKLRIQPSHNRGIAETLLRFCSDEFRALAK